MLKRTQSTKKPARGGSVTERLAGVLNGTRAAKRLRATLDELRGRAVPVHWSNIFGVVAMACFVVLIVTGVFLMFFYTPSSDTVAYSGPYVPLEGIEVSKAYASTLAVSLETPGGLLMRQAHHWAGLLMPAAIVMQLLVSFFTGAFRRPRRGSWVLLFLIFVAALAGGWSGYALPDDLLSGTGLRIFQGIVLGIPVVGTWAADILFGGEFPGSVLAFLYPLHIAIVPLALAGLLVLRIRAAYRSRPPQLPGQGGDESRVAGIPLWPQMATRAAGLFAIAAGLIFAMASAVTVGPIWAYGPSSPGEVSAGSQPDWYTGFLDGALRLVPPGWEIEWLGRTWTLAVLVPLLVVGLFLLLIVVYPFLEEWVTGDHREHHVLERPRSAPGRTAVGVAAMVFYATLWGAASADILATQFAVGLESTIRFFQTLLLVGPIAAFMLTKRIAIGLQKKDREVLLHGYETGRIVRMPGGNYVEVHEPVGEAERWRLSDEGARTGIAGDRSRKPNSVRDALARLLLEDRLRIPLPTESRELAHRRR